MGQPWIVTAPDVGQVTNLNAVRGELWQAFGSRAYPARYTYDAQGRMTTRTTWEKIKN